MIDKILAFLSLSPVVSIVLTVALIAFLAWLFRDTITAYIKKKYNLYSKEDLTKVLDTISEKQAKDNKSKMLLGIPTQDDNHIKDLVLKELAKQDGKV